MEIADSLQTALSQDHQDRAAAEASLNQLHQHNHSEFLKSLSLELLDDHKPTGSRQMAAIIMKSCLDAKDSVVRAELRQKWVTINPMVKDQIKDHLLKTLESAVSKARHSSSQVIAKIASVEFPRCEWHELIGLLVTNITRMETNVHLKIGSMETLGYVCEEVSLEDLGVNQVDDVLIALLQSMTVRDHSFEVRLASVRALYNALRLAHHSFENEVKRNGIMETLGNVAVSETVELRQAAFECLVLISSLHYCHLSSHMERLLSLTLKAMWDEEEPISLQAIEFWSSIYEVEIAIASDGEEYWGNGTGIFLHCHFIEAALPYLVPVLLQTLLRQAENLEEFDESWNLSMAAGTCLQLVARTVGDAIIPLVTSFVDSKLGNDWRVCEACLVAFGILLEGPLTEMLAGVIHRRLDMFLDSITNLNSRVRNRAAWIFGRIFQMPHRTTNNHPVLPIESLANIIHALLECIRTDVLIVANKSCTAIYLLAKGRGLWV